MRNEIILKKLSLSEGSDETKINVAIKETRNPLSQQVKSKLKLDLCEILGGKRVEREILNQMGMKQLNEKEGNHTRILFDSFKESWVEFLKMKRTCSKFMKSL